MTEKNQKKESEIKEVKAEENKKAEDDNKDTSTKNEKTSVEEKLKETEDKLLRSLAEIENQRRRFEKEIKDAFEFGSFNFAKENLAILDNLQRAKIAIKNDTSLKENKDLNKFLENLNIIENDCLSIFERNRIKKVDTLKKKFDPNLHQAMTEVEDDSAEPGTVIQEIQAGYMLGDRLLRPALVGVAKKNSQKNEENSDKKEKK